MRIYGPALSWSLRWKWAVIGGALALVIATVPVYFYLGQEFMPPLEEGSILYMPSTMPGISITEARKVLQVTDRIIKQFPEVDRVLGKAGTGRHLHRPGAALDARNGDYLEAGEGVAPQGYLVFLVGARMGQRPFSGVSRPTISR